MKRHNVAVTVSLPVNAPDDMTSAEVADEMGSIVEDIVASKLVRLPSSSLSSAAIADVWATATQPRQKRSSKKRSSSRRR